MSITIELWHVLMALSVIAIAISIMRPVKGGGGNFFDNGLIILVRLLMTTIGVWLLWVVYLLVRLWRTP